ncbi:hypothetical protein [Phytohabitans rumicis]|uniref:Uncharacterized protein n=1 Tax=Phytohabitans rumicis TaxID=1076125 RepID=A0A6V8L0F0_9ACTN|nr:hypothetical protein [Phytohabitans rumicis]GFJ89574.1 hypothetical protein Prum_032160 [Phytohabitans rumicis]
MVLYKAAVWAANNEPILEVARRRPRMGGASLIAGLCCLVVVAIVVLGLMMAARGRRGRR